MDHNRSKRKQSNRSLKGRLQGVMSLPLDIFCEIAMNLTPHDLLRLSRSSRELRNFLTSKSSKTIWKKAEAFCGMPECPPDLSSPQYASLVFDTSFCTICNQTGTTRLFFVFRLRVCRECEHSRIKLGRDIPSVREATQMAPDLEAMLSIYWLSPAADSSGRPSHFPESPTEGPDPFRPIRAPTFYLPDIEEVLVQYLSFGSDEEKRKFASERRGLVRQIRQHGEALHEWLDQRRQSRSEANAKVRDSRRTEILKRLVALGYNELDFRTYADDAGWKWKKLIDAPRELTERSWQKIRPQLEETIRMRRQKPAREAREARRRTQLTALVKEVMSSDDSCFVTVDMALQQLPTAQEIMNNPDPLVSFQQLDSELFKSQIRALGKAWIEQLESDCAKLLWNDQAGIGTTEVPPLQTSEELCQHATSFFAVQRRAIHANLQLMTFNELVREVKMEYEESLLAENKASFNWSFLTRVCQGPNDLTHALYRAVSVSAKTQDEMLDMGSCFVCRRCDEYLQVPMTWSELVHHYYPLFTTTAEYAASTARTNSQIDRLPLLYGWGDLEGSNNHTDIRRGQLAHCLNSSIPPTDLALSDADAPRPCGCPQEYICTCPL